MDESTNSQHTMALIFAVRKDDSLTMPPRSERVFATAFALLAFRAAT